MTRLFSYFILVATAWLVASCSTTGPGAGADPAARRASLESSTDAALGNLRQQVVGAGALLDSAKGVLVFPSVLEAGLVVGASRGDGALRKGGETVSYHRTTSGTWGLQAGAQSTAVFLLFMTDDALRQFEQSRGWSVGVDANVTVVSVGANAQLTTETAQQPIVGFVLSNRGLMAGVTMNGTRITPLRL